MNFKEQKKIGIIVVISSILAFSSTTSSAANKCANYWINPATGKRECVNSTQRNTRKTNSPLFLISNTKKSTKYSSDGFMYHVVKISIVNNTSTTISTPKLNYNLSKAYRNAGGVVYQRETIYSGDMYMSGLIPPGGEIIFEEKILTRIRGFSGTDIMPQVMRFSTTDNQAYYYNF